MFDRHRPTYRILSGAFLLSLGTVLLSCSSDDEPTGPPPTYGATARVRNALVGDGAQNTSVDIRLDQTDLLEEDIQYLLAGAPSPISLPAASATVTLEMLLTGTAAVLNPGHTESLTDGTDFVFYAIGDIRQSGTATAPTLQPLPTRPPNPPAGSYTVIFLHALAGNADPVDIYIDGLRVATGLGYGEASDARTDGVAATHTVVVTPEGSAPGAADLFSATAGFFAEEKVFVVAVVHDPAGNGFGDAAQPAGVWVAVYE